MFLLHYVAFYVSAVVFSPHSVNLQPNICSQLQHKHLAMYMCCTCVISGSVPLVHAGKFQQQSVHQHVQNQNAGIHK